MQQDYALNAQINKLMQDIAAKKEELSYLINDNAAKGEELAKTHVYSYFLILILQLKKADQEKSIHRMKTMNSQS